MNKNKQFSVESVINSGEEGTPILGHIRMCGRNGRVFEAKNLRMGVNFFLKTCGWVIILRHKTSGLVTILIILPGNEWFSFKLNKTYCNLVNFGSCFIVTL